MKERFKQSCAVYLILIKDGQIPLFCRQNTGWCDGQYGLIAGHVDEGESIRQAMVREAKEEAGIDIDPGDLQLVHVMHRNHSAETNLLIDFFWIAKKWSGEIKNNEPAKCDHFRWFPADKFPENVVYHMGRGVTNFLHNKIYDELYWQ